MINEQDIATVVVLWHRNLLNYCNKKDFAYIKYIQYRIRLNWFRCFSYDVSLRRTTLRPISYRSTEDPVMYMYTVPSSAMHDLRHAPPGVINEAVEKVSC